MRDLHGKPGSRAEKGETIVTYYSERDHLGRYHFSLEWWAEHFHSGPGPCGQHFFCDPQPYIEKARARGDKIIELDERASDARHP